MDLRSRSISATGLIWLPLALALLAFSPAHGQPAAPCPHGLLTGKVTFVRDGDTIEVAHLPVRLNGLAAPEGHESGGSAATRAMRGMVLGRIVRCELDGERTHDRCVAVCYLAGQDISETMVRAGLARDCPRFSGGRYRGAEAQAAAAGATIGGSYPLPGYCRPR